MLERAVELGKANLSEDDPDVLVTAFQLATVLRQSGDTPGARRVLEEAYAAGQWRLGDTDALMLQISHDIGTVAEELGNRHEARKAFGRVAELGPATLGADHQAVARARAYLGQTPDSVRLGPPSTPAAFPAPGSSPEPPTTAFPPVPSSPSSSPSEAPTIFIPAAPNEPAAYTPPSPAEQANTYTPLSPAEPTTAYELPTRVAPTSAYATPTPAPALTAHTSPAREEPSTAREEPSTAQKEPSTAQKEPTTAFAPASPRSPVTPGLVQPPPAAAPVWRPADPVLSAPAESGPSHDAVDEPTTIQPVILSRADAPAHTVPKQPAPGQFPPHQPAAYQPAPDQPVPSTYRAAPGRPEAQPPRQPVHGQAVPGGLWLAPDRSVIDGATPGLYGAPAPRSDVGAGYPAAGPLVPAQRSPEPWTPPPGATYPGYGPPNGEILYQRSGDLAYRRRGVSLFAAIAAGLAAVIAVVALVFVLAFRATGQPGGANVPTLAGPAPSDVKLTDRGTEIEVTWTDPSAGTVSFMVAMGHPGEQLKPISTLGPGQTSYRTGGLNPGLNYCFAVIAVYRSDKFSTSPQTCTSRASAVPRPSTSK